MKNDGHGDCDQALHSTIYMVSTWNKEEFVLRCVQVIMVIDMMGDVDQKRILDDQCNDFFIDHAIGKGQKEKLHGWEARAGGLE